MSSTLKSALLALVVAGSAVGFNPAAHADEREPRLRTYSAGAGFQTLRFRTEDGRGAGASGPAATFNYSIGRRWAFGMRGTFMFPLHGSQNEAGQGRESHNLASEFDSQRIAFDVQFLVLRRLHLNENLDLVVGGGIDVTTLRLVSKTYMPTELISGGFSGLARIERRFGRRFFYGGEVNAAIGLLDFINHDNRAVFVAPISLSAFIGVSR